MPYLEATSGCSRPANLKSTAGGGDGGAAIRGWQRGSGLAVWPDGTNGGIHAMGRTMVMTTSMTTLLVAHAADLGSLVAVG